VFLPQTPLGRRSAMLVAAGVLLIGLTTLLANAADLGGSVWLAVTIVPAFAAVLLGGVVAAVAVVRRGERGGVALLPLLLGLALAALLAGELIAPHE
jgi:cytochrome bd-type quinol oxidase subunit 2